MKSKNIVKRYNWLFEFIAIAALLVLAITLAVPDTGTKIVYYLVGSTFIVFGLYRIYPIIKTTKKLAILIIFIIEALLFLACGITIIVKGSEGEELKKILGYLIGSAFFVRGAIFFLGTTVFNEPGDLVTYLLHLILLSFGVTIIARGGFSVNALRWAFFGILIVGMGFLLFFGVQHVLIYKRTLKEKQRKAILEETTTEVLEDKKPNKKIEATKEQKLLEDEKVIDAEIIKDEPKQIETTENSES